MKLFTNFYLIPELSDGMGPEISAILVENGIIKKCLKEGETSVPELKEQTEVIDCRGMTLMPGLIDAHTHITGLRNFSPNQLKKPMHFFYHTVMETKKYLEYGFTTIRDCGSFLRISNAVRDAFEEGLSVGPRIISSGKILMPTEIQEADEYYDMYDFTDGADEVRKAARKELAEGADFVKIMASGSALHKQGIPVQPIMTEEEIRTACQIAELKGTYAAAHAHGDGAIRACINAGVRSIEHASFISEETIDLLMEKKTSCYLIPTVSAMYQNPDTTPESWMFLVKKLQDMLDISSICLKKAYQAEACLGFGTDSCPGMDQYEAGIEFRYRQEKLHMKPVDILKQATVNNALILGIEDRCGRIKEGLCADLILVKGRPDQDISVMYHKPEAVYRAGKRFAE